MSAAEAECAGDVGESGVILQSHHSKDEKQDLCRPIFIFFDIPRVSVIEYGTKEKLFYCTG